MDKKTSKINHYDSDVFLKCNSKIQGFDIQGIAKDHMIFTTTGTVPVT